MRKTNTTAQISCRPNVLRGSVTPRSILLSKTQHTEPRNSVSLDFILFSSCCSNCSSFVESTNWHPAYPLIISCLAHVLLNFSRFVFCIQTNLRPICRSKTRNLKHPLIKLRPCQPNGFGYYALENSLHHKTSPSFSHCFHPYYCKWNCSFTIP